MAYTRTDSAVAALGTLAELVPVAVVTRGAARRDRGRPDHRRVRAGPGAGRRRPGRDGRRRRVRRELRRRPRSAAGRWRSGCGSPSSPPDCPYGTTAAHSPRPAGTASTAGGARSTDPDLVRAYGFLADRSRRTWARRCGTPPSPRPSCGPEPDGRRPPRTPLERHPVCEDANRSERRWELCGSHEEACCARAWPARQPRRSAVWRPAAPSRPARPAGTWSSGTGTAASATPWSSNAKARYDSSVDLQAIKIGGYYRSKLITTMAGRAHIPDIAGLKGEDMASYLPNADQFVDLRTLGAEKYRSQYLPWKWDQGVADDGSMIGFPIDCGSGRAPLPVRRSSARRACPYEPADVSRELNTWEKFFAAGEQLQQAAPGDLTAHGRQQRVRERRAAGQCTVRRQGPPLHRRPGACTPRLGARRGGQAARASSRTWSAAPRTSCRRSEDGKLPSQLGASWATFDLKNGVPKTKGRWRVADMPVRPANNGGSFLSVTKACREPERAFKIITWMLDAANQAQGLRRRGAVPVHPRLVRPETDARARRPSSAGRSPSTSSAPPRRRSWSPTTARTTSRSGQPIKDEIKNVGVLGKDPEQGLE